MAGKPTPIFYAAVAAVIIGLLGFALYQARDVIAPRGDQVGKDGGGDHDIDLKDLVGAEAADAMGITTVDEYEFKPSER